MFTSNYARVILVYWIARLSVWGNVKIQTSGIADFRFLSYIDRAPSGVVSAGTLAIL